MLSLILSLLVLGATPSASAPSGKGSSKASAVRGKRGKRGKAGRRKGAKSRGGPGGSASGKPTGMAALSVGGALAPLSVLLSRGRYRQAMVQVRKELETTPQEPDLHSALAVCCGEFGDYPCVDMSVDMALGSSSLPMQRVVAEADALRFLGQAEAAAELRRSSVVSNLRPKRELAQLVRLFGDHQQADDLEGMWDVAHETLALHGDGGVGYALLARTYAHMGDFDEADAWIWIGNLQPAAGASLAIAETELMIARGEARMAVETTDAVRKQVMRNRTLATVRGRALLAAGDIDKAVDLVDLRSWYLGDEIWHPDLIALQALAYAHSGWEAPAMAQVDRLERTYGQYPRAAAAAKEARRLLDRSAP